MAKQQEEVVQKNERAHQELSHTIGKQVIRELGQPDDMRRLQVQHLWADYYRVNVFVGVDLSSAKVRHSYFVTVDGAGIITSSTPKIARRY